MYQKNCQTYKVIQLGWEPVNIKGRCRRMDCCKGKELNSSNVLPQPSGEPIPIVVPTSLQIGWIKPPTFFWAAMETGWDVIMQYTDTPITFLPEHKFEHHRKGCPTSTKFPLSSEWEPWYLTKDYVDNFMSVDLQFPGGGQTTPKLPLAFANTTKSSTSVTRLS